MLFPNVPPIPVTLVHNPEPAIGVLAESTVDVAPQRAWSLPALAVVGFFGNDTTKESEDEAQGALEIVQKRT